MENVILSSCAAFGIAVIMLIMLFGLFMFIYRVYDASTYFYLLLRKGKPTKIRQSKSSEYPKVEYKDFEVPEDVLTEILD